MRTIQAALLLSLLFCLSCRKQSNELQRPNDRPNRNFFPEVNDQNKNYTPIIEYLKANDQNQVLIDKLLLTCGNPLWGDVFDIKSSLENANPELSISNGENENKILILPFLKDSLIRSLLVCEVDVNKKVRKAKLINSSDYKKWSLKKVNGRMSANELTALLLIENYRVLGTTSFLINDNRIFANESVNIDSKIRPYFLERIRYGTQESNMSIRKEDTEITYSVCMYGWAPCSGDLVGVEPGGQSPGYCPYSICIEWTQILQDEYLPDPVYYTGGTQYGEPELFSSGGGGDVLSTETIPDPSILGDFYDDPGVFEDDPMPVTYNFNQEPWPTISSVLSPTQFVKYDKRNCLVLAQNQIAMSGVRDLGYGSAFKVFDANGGPYPGIAKAGIDYIISKLKSQKPVIVGIENRPGTPSSLNADGKTDHFVTIVGSGQDNQGNYLIFYDNATDNESKGTNPLNKLYFDSVTGLITGKSMVPYANAFYDYKVTQIRKNH